MATGDADRRLAGILAADVVGYAAMVGADEPGTLARVRALRTDDVEPLKATHGGRVFKTTGDGFFAAFTSAVQALRCAIAIQDTLRAESNGLRLRIGVHQGEVVPEGDDLLGDGVIVAARLEALAESGGICISGRVREDAAGKITLEVEDIGTPELKNIAQPIRVFRLRPRTPQRTGSEQSDGAAGKPSIAVLAFTNMSGDAEQEYFSDGVAEDIITQLSRSTVLLVIARNSTFTYKGRAVDVREVGRELGVRYVLEGSVRRGGERVRVTAQLIEAESGNHVWAERYDRGLADIFAVQDEIADAVARAIEPAISQTERQRISRKPPESLGAWEAYQRGLWHRSKANVADNARARAFYEQAIRLDPTFTPPYSELAFTLFTDGVFYGTRPLTETMDLALKAAEAALAIDPDDAAAHQAAGAALWQMGNPAGAQHNKRALAIDPNNLRAQVSAAIHLIFEGQPAEGRRLLLDILRRNPRYDDAATLRVNIAGSHYIERDYSEAAEAAERAIAAHPGHPRASYILAGSLGQLGRTETAAAVLRRAIEMSPQAFQTIIAARPGWIPPEYYEHFLDGLRKAGWEG